MAKRASGNIVTRMLTIGILLIFLGSIVGIMKGRPLNSFSAGYISAFEGPKATFEGITYNGHTYTNTVANGASQHEFDSVLHFDADGDGSGMPKIHGEETTVFIPQQSITIPSWLTSNPIFADWFNTNNYITNPQANYSWPIGNDTYYMAQYLLRYYVTFNAEWDGSEGDVPFPGGALGMDNSYSNLGVWIRLDTEPTWYIDGGRGTAYFAIAKLQVAPGQKIYFSTDTTGKSGTGDPRTEVSVSPESGQSAVFLHYNAFVEGNDLTTKAEYYEGHALNPAYFRNQTFIRLDFNHFGVYGGVNWMNPLNPTWTKGDTVTMGFDITVFVIGQWTVQDIQQNPSDYGRFERTSGVGGDWFTMLTDFFFSPLGGLLLTIAVFIFLLIFAPWVIMAIIGMFRGGGKG